MKGTAHLLLGRHGANDHYLGGRYHRADRPPRAPAWLAFPLSDRTIHLFELILPSQRREPVPARRIFQSFSTRYELTALFFARRVERRGGKSYNAESRHSAELDERYEELQQAALGADLAFFKKPTYERYLDLAGAEASFGELRESLIEDNIEHFALGGHDVVARLGRIHSRARRLGSRGIAVKSHIGAGSFFAEQVMKRRLLFGLEVSEPDRMRAYIDRLLRLVPIWNPALQLPPRRAILALAGDDLARVHARFQAAVAAARALPDYRNLLAILAAPGAGGGEAEPTGGPGRRHAARRPRTRPRR
jgi:hypothetical protein